jgi:hypothetical protein
MTSTACYPWFHTAFPGVPNTIVRSGCSVGADGNIPCKPEDMRANAEAQLAALGFPRQLSLEAYTLARYMQGEVGNGTPEERVAVGEAAVNRAKLERRSSVLDILLYRQAQGHPNRGWYGPIHGVGTGVSTAPYGRWATTSADPSLLTLLLADLVISGETNNFSRNADDQDGPEYWIKHGQASLHNYVRKLASNNKFWVGPLPGVDHWKTFLQFTPSKLDLTVDREALLQRGLEALTLPAQRPQWDPNLPVCGKPAGTGTLVFLALVGFLGGAWMFTRGYFQAKGV